ncbi:hypothetical protein C8R45DRAFT_1083127 [Mycena sanguinolenta]|nr:hypothetical protein C8R45DRAFT_1083127 [Mycena sanguinolenta]
MAPKPFKLGQGRWLTGRHGPDLAASGCLVYIGPDSASPYSSYISTPPDIPDLPEPPSPGSSSSSRTSGLPSPPATNSTGSGSTGDPASIAIRGGGNMLNGTNVKTFHAAFASAAADDEHDDIDNDIDDEDGEGEDNTARLDQKRRHSASENVLALERVKSLTQRNKMALDKLSSFSRLGSPAPSAGGTGSSGARRASVTRSPHPPALSSSSASTSDSRSSHSNSNSNSNSSHSASSSSHRDTTSSSSHRDSASTSSSRDSTRPILRRSRTQESHQSGSETERDDDHDRDYYSPQQRQRDLENRPTTPLAPRQRLVSAPASPQKHLTARQVNSQGSGSGSVLRSPRRNRVSGLGLNLSLDGGEGGEASSPEDVTRAALAAVASVRTGTGTARRTNMSPTTAGSGKKRQPLPREWGASSNGSGRFSASPPTSPPQHHTSPNKRHSLAGSTASASSFSPSRHAHSNSTSSTSTIGSTAHGQRASTVRDLARRHQARYLSEDLGSNRDGGSSPGMAEERERRQSLRAGSAESALGAGRSLLGEGLRAAGLAGRERERDRGGGDVFSPHERERTPARVEWADEARSRSASRQSGHGRAATSLEYTSYDREDEPRTAPPLRTYRSSAYVLDAGARSGSAMRRYRDRDRGVSIEREREQDGERERYAPSPSPFGSIAQRRHGSGGGGGSGQQEHTKLMGDSLTMFEGHLARIAGTNERTTNDLAQHAARIVSAAERLNGILRAGTAKALEEQIDAEVSGADRGVAGAELAEVWRRVGGEWREGLRVSDELVRGVTGFLLGVGRVVRDFGDGRGSDEGRRSTSPDAGGRRSAESRRSDDRRVSTGRESALGLRPSSVINLRHEPTPPPRNATPSRRLLTPREQRELHATGAIVASDSQETVQPARHNIDYDPSPTPASRKQQNQTTLDRSRTLPPISIPKPLPTLPSESTSTLRRNQTTTGATGGSSQRRRTITSSTVRGPGGLLPSTTTPTTAVTAHTVSNSPQVDNAARMAFPTLPRSDSDKSANGNMGRGRNNTVTFSRPSTVALTGLQMQHERERQRTISGTNNSNQLDPAAIAIAAAAGPSHPAEDTRKRSSAVADRPRMSLDGGVESIGRGHAADRSAAAGLSMMNQKRERRRTVTDIWPPSAS